jgi:hypothetical protein
MKVERQKEELSVQTHPSGELLLLRGGWMREHKGIRSSFKGATLHSPKVRQCQEEVTVPISNSHAQKSFDVFHLVSSIFPQVIMSVVGIISNEF